MYDKIHPRVLLQNICTDNQVKCYSSGKISFQNLGRHCEIKFHSSTKISFQNKGCRCNCKTCYIKMKIIGIKLNVIQAGKSVFKIKDFTGNQILFKHQNQFSEFKRCPCHCAMQPWLVTWRRYEIHIFMQKIFVSCFDIEEEKNFRC